MFFSRGNTTRIYSTVHITIGMPLKQTRGIVLDSECLFCKKKCGKYTFYVWKAVWCLPSGRGRRLAQYFGGFLHQIKVRQQIGRKVSMQVHNLRRFVVHLPRVYPRCQRMRRFEAFLYLAAQKLNQDKKFEIDTKIF